MKHHDRGLGVTLAKECVADSSKRIDRQLVYSVPRHHAPKLENHPFVLGNADLFACQAFIDGPQFQWIKTARDFSNLRWLGIIEMNKVFSILWALGNDSIRFASDALLDLKALHRKFIIRALEFTADAIERMKGNYIRRT